MCSIKGLSFSAKSESSRQGQVGVESFGLAKRRRLEAHFFTLKVILIKFVVFETI